MTFWMLLCLFGYIVFDILTHHWYADYSFEYGEMIYDTDPRFVLEFERYVPTTYNVVLGKLNQFIMPFTACVTTVLLIRRDYGDRFYEIEKGAGVRPFTYLLGRISALVTLNFVIALIAAFGFLHLYVFTRGGVASIDLGTYFADSTVRIMRNIVFYGLPGILLYISLTYFFGCITKSGTAASVVSIGYALFCVLGKTILRRHLPQVYFEYLSPSPEKLGHYLYAYDSAEFDDVIKRMDTSLGKAALCIGILVGLALLYTAISYYLIRQRDQ